MGDGMKQRMFLAIIACGALVLAATWVYIEFGVVSPMKDKVLALLKDPQAAQFRNLTYQGPWSPTRGVLCGEVNSKNTTGGYVGFQWFMVSAAGAEILSDIENDIYKSGEIKLCDFKRVWWHLRW
jgi:hypothetical protein